MPGHILTSRAKSASGRAQVNDGALYLIYKIKSNFVCVNLVSCIRFLPIIPYHHTTWLVARSLSLSMWTTSQKQSQPKKMCYYALRMPHICTVLVCIIVIQAHYSETIYFVCVQYGQITSLHQDKHRIVCSPCWFHCICFQMEYLRELSRRHEALKKRIHAFRIPLSPTGRRLMGLVYFSIPIIAGYFIMEVNYFLIWLYSILIFLYIYYL